MGSRTFETGYEEDGLITTGSSGLERATAKPSPLTEERDNPEKLGLHESSTTHRQLNLRIHSFTFEFYET